MQNRAKCYKAVYDCLGLSKPMKLSQKTCKIEVSSASECKKNCTKIMEKKRCKTVLSSSKQCNFMEKIRNCVEQNNVGENYVKQ